MEQVPKDTQVSALVPPLHVDPKDFPQLVSLWSLSLGLGTSSQASLLGPAQPAARQASGTVFSEGAGLPPEGPLQCLPSG